MKLRLFFNPFFLIPILHLTQFLIWLVTFSSNLKDHIPGLSGVPYYLTSSAITKYVFFFMIYYISVFIGYKLLKPKIRDYIPQPLKKTEKSIEYNNGYSLSKRGVVSFTADVLFVIVIITELYFLFIAKDILFNPELLLAANTQGLAQVAYITLQNEENLIRTTQNFLPFIAAVFAYIYLNNKYLRKKFKFRIILLIIISLFIFMITGRQLALVVWMILILFTVKYKLGLSRKIKVRIIIALIFGLLVVIILSEIFRFGVLNSSKKGISLFSIENVIDVSKYLLVAYISKNVNNAMIALDSDSVYSPFFTGSRIFYLIFSGIFGTQEYYPVIDPGPHGTLDFMALIWIDWGWLSPIFLCAIGVIIGLAYRMFISSNYVFWDILYAIIYPGILANLRINYFFLNMFIYPLFITLVLWILNETLGKRVKIRRHHSME